MRWTDITSPTGADDVTDDVRRAVGVVAHLEALESRLRALEDRWEILQAIATYGAAVDAGLADEVAELWTSDGVYDVDGNWILRGRDELAGMVRSRHHQGLIMGGCGHVMGLPVIEVDGDTAVARHHSQLVVHDDEGFEVQRVTAHRWSFVRTSQGWKATHRRCQLLDGADVGRDVLAGQWTPSVHEEQS